MFFVWIIIWRINPFSPDKSDKGFSLFENVGDKLDPIRKVNMV